MDELILNPERRAEAQSTRRILTSWDDVAKATLTVSANANQSLAIFTHDLEPRLYNQLEFLQNVKRLVLSNRAARVRILSMDPTLAIKETHLLVEIARQMSTFIEIRAVNKEFHDQNMAFLIADETSFVYRVNTGSAEGVSDIQAPSVARRHLDLFNQIWERSEHEREFKRLHV